MTYFKAFPARVPPVIDRSGMDGGDGSGSGLPLMLKVDQPATIKVRVSGQPAPVVRWYVGPMLVQTDRIPTVVAQRAPFCDGSGGLSAVQHSLTMDNVTDELEQGVTVVATNDVGRDIVSLAVKTYKGRKQAQRPVLSRVSVWRDTVLAILLVCPSHCDTVSKRMCVSLLLSAPRRFCFFS